MNKLFSLQDMEPIAREATRIALAHYPEPPKSEQVELTLGKMETESEGIFEIYIPKERPKDAIVISRACVDRSTGDVTVEVFLKE